MMSLARARYIICTVTYKFMNCQHVHHGTCLYRVQRRTYRFVQSCPCGQPRTRIPEGPAGLRRPTASQTVTRGAGYAASTTPVASAEVRWQPGPPSPGPGPGMSTRVPPRMSTGPATRSPAALSGGDSLGPGAEQPAHGSYGSLPRLRAQRGHLVHLITLLSYTYQFYFDE
jgi:hypothetical protein